jgi:hypothetical protein
VIVAETRRADYVARLQDSLSGDYWQTCVVVLQTWGDVQSASPLHCTQTPANDACVVSPHTWLGDFPSAVQSVPVGAGVKEGAIGEPVHAGLVRQTVFDVGRSVGSSTEVVAPEPLHSSFWQSPGVCPVDGTKPNARFDVPHVCVDVLQVANVQALPVAGQSASMLHCTQPAAALQTGVEPPQVTGVPATHACDVLHVDAAVKTLPLHEDAAQSVGLVHCTQPAAASQTLLVAEQSTAVGAVQTFDVHWLGATYDAPAHPNMPGSQSVVLMHPLPSAHGAQLAPPQSLSVSSASLVLSEQ